VDNIGDVVIEQADEGFDFVDSSVSYTLGTGVEWLTLQGTDAIDGTGNSQDNLLRGNSGNNLLDGREGADSLFGEAGNDTYVVDNMGDFVIENAGRGLDTIQSQLSAYTLGNTSIENLTLTGTTVGTSTGRIDGTGNSLDNVITGNSFINMLDGGIGADTMMGGDSGDYYVVDNADDVVIEQANEGRDVVYATVSHTLGNNVEYLQLMGSDAIDGTGNSQDNTLRGNSAANVLDGGFGNDLLDGDAGADTLLGGDGSDYLLGADDNDTYLFDLGHGNDTVIESSGFDTLQFQQSISQADIGLFQANNGDLQFGYVNNSSDFITIQSQNQSASSVERFELSDGQFMTNADINAVVQSMVSYATDHDISVTSVNDVTNNQDLMNIVVAGWHS
jgi:Ca2+-binding RTX toxin-like protein